MTLRLADENRVWVKKVENKGKVGVILVTTSRKDKRNNVWVYSDFYVILMSRAFDGIDDLTAKYIDGEKYENSGLLKKGFPINLKSVTLSNEPYEKDGKKVYQNYRLTCWDWDWVSGERGESSGDNDDENPFDNN